MKYKITRSEKTSQRTRETETREKERAKKNDETRVRDRQ